MVALVACTAVETSFAADTQANQALLNESFTQFDQKLDSGWRTLMVQMKYPETAELIEQYQTQHSKTLLKWQKASLAYHLGIVYSLANERQKAIHSFRQALAPKLLGNPAYVEAHIAFEAGNKQALLRARHKVAVLAPSTTRTEDLEEADAMIKYFGQPFEVTFGALNCEEQPASQASGWFEFCKAMHSKYGALYQQRASAP